MPTVQDVLSVIEDIAPSRFAFSFDKIGLLVGDPSHDVGGIVTTLDCTLGALEFCLATGSDLIVAHHPLIWEPLATIRTDSAQGRVLERLLGRGVSLIAAHTNWDCAPGGVNDALAERLGLTDVRPIGSSNPSAAWKLVCFAPLAAAEGLIDALSSAGAGRIGAYERCAFVQEGTGTFLGDESSQPAIGRPGSVEKVAEARIEMVVSSKHVASVESALLSAHPYETPAFDWVRLRDEQGHPIGRIGRLPVPMEVGEFVGHCEERLGTRCLAWGPAGQCSMVAVCGGSADGEWREARLAGADVFVTGEVKHDRAVDVVSEGFRIVQAGHFATEHPGMEAMAVRLSERLPGTPCRVFLPEAGSGGRAW